MRKIRTIVPFLLENYLIVGILHSDWINVFGGKIPTFEVLWDKNIRKLVIQTIGDGSNGN